MNIFEVFGQAVRLWWPNTRDDGRYFSEREIIIHAAPMLHKGGRRTGIYFLIEDEEIVYIGQSVDVRSRIDQHTIDAKNFNRYFMIHCDEEELNNLEAYYINKFKPKYNKYIPRLS